jgi:hypothetical protein
MYMKSYLVVNDTSEDREESGGRVPEAEANRELRGPVPRCGYWRCYVRERACEGQRNIYQG